MSELRECPFCENEDIKLYYQREALVWKLECTVCYVTYIHRDRTRIVKFWNSRPKEETLQKTFRASYNNIENERDILQVKLISYTNIEKERDILQDKLDISKKDIDAARNSFIDIQKKYDTIQKSLDENIKTTKQEYDVLKTKLNDEQTAYKYYMSTMQTRIDNAEKALLDIISLYNSKLDSIRLDGGKIAHDIMEKIR